MKRSLLAAAVALAGPWLVVSACGAETTTFSVDFADTAPDAACVPDCAGRVCGDDGCGGSCGSCAPGGSCSAGQCEAVCVPDCTDRTCGSDGCEGSCGSCPAGATCAPSGVCNVFGAAVFGTSAFGP